MNRTARTRPYYADVSLLDPRDNSFTLWTDFAPLLLTLLCDPRVCEIVAAVGKPDPDDDVNLCYVVRLCNWVDFQDVITLINDCVIVENLLADVEVVGL